MSVLLLTLPIFLIIASSQDVICDQSRECEGQNITTDGNVICSGYYGCRDTVIDAGGDVTCSGDYSCRPDYYFARQAGSGSKPYTITAGGTITCSGYNSCRTAKVKADGGIIFSGMYAGRRMMIRSPYIEATGAHSTYKAVFIDSGEYSTMTVKLADKGSSRNPGAILCRSGATCNVLCETKRACMHFRYGCREGATCNIQPAACLDSANWDKMVRVGPKRIMCPLEIVGLSTSGAMTAWFDKLDFTDDEGDGDDGEFVLDDDDKWRDESKKVVVMVNEETMMMSQYMWIAVISAVTSMMVVLVAYILCIKASQTVKGKVVGDSYSD